MLRKIRLVAALLFFTMITLLFLDFTGTVHSWFGWMAKIQFLPAVLALNVGVMIALVLLTLLLGRVYCSVVCPYGVLAVFIVALVAGVVSLTALIAPYSAYGRIISNLLTPLYQWGNNVLALWAERVDSYAFYSVDVWMKGLSTFVVAVGTVIVLFILAWRGGRTYCNTICPVGTVLGLLSRYSYFKPVIDTSKCNGCGLCARNCKSSCINPKAHEIDYSRCVACMDCLGKCRQDAIKYVSGAIIQKKQVLRREETGQSASQSSSNSEKVNTSRRNFFTVSALLATSAVMKAQEKKVDGGLAPLIDKKNPKRATSIVPAGARGLRHFAQHCTACQLCVSVCPNQILRPSGPMNVDIVAPNVRNVQKYVLLMPFI